MAERKTCPKCGKRKAISKFPKDKRRKDGTYPYCKECHRAYQRESYRSGGDRYRKQRLGAARRRAARDGVPFTLTLDTFPEIPERCPCCDRRMEVGDRGGRGNSPSLDRLVPEDGYTPTNTVVLCNRCNATKQDVGPAELYRIADWLWREYRARGLPLPPTELYPQQEKTDE